MGMDAAERCKGVLLGLAVGNVLGLQWEGQPRYLIAVQSLIPPREEADRRPDDDLAMAMVLGRHLSRNPEGICAHELLEEYADWMRTNGRGIGGLTREVLHLAAEGLPKPAEVVWEERGGPSGIVLGNGSVMRCAPIAIRYRNDLGRAVEEARLDSSLTHWDDRCCCASAAAVAIICGHLNGADDAVGSAVSLLESLGAQETVLEPLTTEAVDKGFPDTAELDAFDAGSCMVALRVARWASQWAPDFEQSLIRVLRAGGDTDTNGAIAGAILGTRFPDEIPRPWLECIPLRSEIENLANALSTATGTAEVED